VFDLSKSRQVGTVRALGNIKVTTTTTFTIHCLGLQHLYEQRYIIYVVLLILG